VNSPKEEIFKNKPGTGEYVPREHSMHTDAPVVGSDHADLEKLKYRIFAQRTQYISRLTNRFGLSCERYKKGSLI
jgi:hypothetical protein